MIMDPIELMEARIERLNDDYVDENTCMQCKRKVDYLIYQSITGDGPAICEECYGCNPWEENPQDFQLK